MYFSDDKGLLFLLKKKLYKKKVLKKILMSLLLKEKKKKNCPWLLYTIFHIYIYIYIFMSTVVYNLLASLFFWVYLYTTFLNINFSIFIVVNELSIKSSRFVYLIFLWAQTKLIYHQIDYMFKLNSFSYQTSSNLFRNYLINLFFPHI